MSEPTDDEPDSDTCLKPCDQIFHNSCCSEYWERMVREGFWNNDEHRWTEKGWKEITKC